MKDPLDPEDHNGSLPLLEKPSQPRPPRSRCLQFLRRVDFASIFLPLLVVLQIYLGGLVFSKLEGPKELSDLHKKVHDYEASVNSTAASIVNDCNEDVQGMEDKLNETLLNLLNEVGYSIPNNYTNPSDWDIWGSMYYAATLYTTVGYGSFTPSTFWGQFATMIYSIIGIPLMLIFLANWGKLFFRCFKWTWRMLLKIWIKFCFCYRKRAHYYEKQLKEHSDAMSLPSSAAIFLLVFWIVVCAGIFMLIEEDWPFFKAVYFFFISLTTIGLGDVTPTSHATGVWTFPLIWLGLAVVSMCISVLQNNLEVFMNRLLTQVEDQYKKALNTDEDGKKFQLGDLRQNLGWRDKIMFAMMDDSKVNIIEKSIKKKNNLRTAATQTFRPGNTIQIQAGDSFLGGTVSDADNDGSAQQSRLAQSKTGLKRSYIYNVND